MKILDFEKVISILKRIKIMPPYRDGTLPIKIFTRENMDYLIDCFSAQAMEINIEEIEKEDEMRPSFIDREAEEITATIRDALIASDGITCDAELYEPELYGEKKTYVIPSMYSITVDYNKLAEAVYNAGFRKVDKEHDTLVCSAVKKDPLAFVDILREQAEVAGKGESKSEEFVPLLREAACVIANLLLTEEDWHKAAKEDQQ